MRLRSLAKPKKGVGPNNNDFLINLLIEKLKISIKSLLLGEDNIEEVSCMASGAVSGGPGQSAGDDEGLIR